MTREEYSLWKQSQLTIDFFAMLERLKKNIDSSILDTESPQHDAVRFNYLLGQRTTLRHLIDYVPQEDTEGV